MLCDCLTVAFDAIILSKLLCASSACSSVEHLSMMPKNSYRSIQMESLYSSLYRASELFSTRYCRLFKTTCVIRHIVCINNLLPPLVKCLMCYEIEAILMNSLNTNTIKLSAVIL